MKSTISAYIEHWTPVKIRSTMVCPMDPRGRIVLPTLNITIRLGKEIVIAETKGTLVTRNSVVIEL